MLKVDPLGGFRDNLFRSALMGESLFNKYFVRRSNPASVKAGKISLLAVAEVIFSVAAYWWVAWYFGTYAHLLISIIISPLVLLRSDESMELGVEMFSRYYNSAERSMRSTKGVSTIILSAVVAGIASWLAADWLLPGHESWSLFWRSALIAIFALIVGLATAVAVTASEAVAVTATGAGAGTIAVFASGAVEIEAWVAVAGAVAAAGAVVASGVAVRAVAVAGARTGMVIAPGVGVGFLVRAAATRLIASLRYIHRGVPALPDNWWRSMFQVDLRCAPELVPGIGEKIPTLNFDEVFENFAFQTDMWSKFYFAQAVLILFIPSLFYRYALKSTIWLYLPLVYVAHWPARFQDGKGRLIWARALPTKIIEWLRFGLAVLSLIVAVAALIDAAALRALLMAVGAGETSFTIFSLLLVLDFSAIRPWQYFSLSSAALTIPLFLGLDSIRKEMAEDAPVEAFEWKIKAAIIAARFRSLFVYIWMMLALYYFAEFAYSQCRLPDWMASWLEWPFGPSNCLAPVH